MIPQVEDKLYREVWKVLEERQRRGEFWLREEMARSLKNSKNGKPGLQERVLLGIGDSLISLGLRLKERSNSESPMCTLEVC